jgi:PAS domain S-box-containing protein
MFKFNFPIKIALFYLCFGILWILLSDKAILSLIENGSVEQITRIQHYKGVFFITLTSVFLFLISFYYYKKQEKLIDQGNLHMERLNNMVESVTDGFFAVDKDWIITHINITCARLFGLEKEKLIGKKLWDLFPQSTNSKSYHEYNRAFNEQIAVHFEDYLEHNKTWFDVNAYPFKNGLSIYFRDITQQILIQRELMLGKSNLDALINNTNDLIWSIDKEMNLLSFNKPFFEAYKYFSPMENIRTGGKAVFDNSQVSQDWRGYYTRALSGERFSVEYYSDPEGQVFYTETSFNPIYNEQKEIIGVGCFSRDISVRKKNEEERLLLIQKLLTQNKDLEEFSFITSHNLRSPVASILGLVQIFNRKDAGDQHNITIIESLEKSARNLDETIVDLTKLLDVRHRLDEAKEVVRFDSVMETVTNMLAIHIEKNKPEIHADFEVTELFTVKSYITNIFMNLVSNAIKYRKDKIRPIIHISSENTEEGILIKVADNGIGLDLDKYEKKLFTPYKRFHDHVAGKGIGLYLTKSQVDALGGSIKIKSSPGEGCTFYIYLKNAS